MVSTTTERIAASIREAMASKNVSQAALSDSTGIARMTLRRRLTGGSDFTVGELHLVCRDLDLDVPSLLAEAAA